MALPHDISDRLIDWYGTVRRDLPWRETADPYRIWLSEVILQQTRVAQGQAYYLRFVERFPDVVSLARADEDEVLKLWQGLGYYSRARNLHAAARQVAEQYGGRFPERYDEVRALRGVGDYTAAAVCSIAYGQPRAVVDGNVYRVLSRLFALEEPIDTAQGRKTYARLAQELLDEKRPGLHNQAMMEFGALQCLPRNPACDGCPLRDLCLACRRETPEAFPVRQGRTAVRPRHFHYLFLRCSGRTLLVRRSGDDIWRGLYEFPLIETASEASFEEVAGGDAFRQRMEGVAFTRAGSVAMPRHQLSHQTIHATFHELIADRLPDWPEAIPVAEERLGDYAVSRLTDRYLERRHAGQDEPPRRGRIGR